MDRVFLDANVLFSASYSGTSRLLMLWDLADVELLSSEYAVEEARRNILLARPHCLIALGRLSDRLRISCSLNDDLPDDIVLDDKDRPILVAAIRSGATHLLTGDKAHFGHLFGTNVCGVLVLTPGDYLRGIRG